MSNYDDYDLSRRSRNSGRPTRNGRPVDGRRSSGSRSSSYERSRRESYRGSELDVDFYEDTIRKISISLAEKAELVSICVKGKSSIPILYSDEITFSQPQNKTEYFRIPSWPPLNMTFTYIPEDYDDSEIIVTEYTVSPEGNTVLLKQTLEIPHTKTEGSSL